MKLTYLKTSNFRALDSAKLEITSFGCIIGENNAGKSSLLHAIIHFCEGKNIQPTDYYNLDKPVRITGWLTDITIDDLNSLGEHKDRVENLLIDGKLKLVRIFQNGEKPELRCLKLQPKEERFREEWLNENLSGKAGIDLVAFAKKTYGLMPKVLAAINAKQTQKQLKESIALHRENLAANDMEEMEGDLPTGIPASVTNILPEIVYIPAVKDLAADCRTADSATFGKILGLLLNVIEPELAKIEEGLTLLNTCLNVVNGEDGITTDGRFEGIKQVESKIQANLRENFPMASVYLRIPPPSTKTILQNAKIDIHDGGCDGSVDSMGDGLKRSIIFSLFKTYAQLASLPEWQKKGVSKASSRLMFLFEEPELYLHPQAQRTLFEALATLSENYSVMVTTHSPAFFSAERTKTFTKIIKKHESKETKPSSELKSVDLAKEINARDALQIVCFENNEAAFFASEVLLVEGDSDLVALKHVSRCLDSTWDFDKRKIAVVRVHGKGNFKRFTEFFQRFEIKSMIFTDLDIILKDFDKLGLPPTSKAAQLRNSLLQALDVFIRQADRDAPDADATRELFRGTSFRGKFQRFLRVATEMREGIAPTEINLLMIGDLLSDSAHAAKVEALKSVPQFAPTKLELLAELRNHRIFVLSKGAIEDYYDPTWEGIGQADKPTKAEIMRRMVGSRESAIALADEIPAQDGRFANEFDQIFGVIFAAVNTTAA